MTGSGATPPGEDGSAGPTRKPAPETTRAAEAAPAPAAGVAADGVAADGVAADGGPAAESTTETESTTEAESTTEVKDSAAGAAGPVGDAGPAASGRSAGRSPSTLPAAAAPAAGRTRGRNLYWLLPVLAFVGGLLIGGGVIAAADLGSSDQPAAVAPTPGATPGGTDSGSGATTVTVPAACADGLDRADKAAQAAKDGLTGITQLDTTAIRQALDRLQTLQPQIRDLADRCRVEVSTSN